MSLKSSLLAASVLIGTTLAATSAFANPIFLGYSINGGSITTLASTTIGVASGSTIDSGFTISLSATGSPAVVEPNLSSNTVTVSGSTAGIIRLYASETGITTQVPSFSLGLSNNPLSDTNVMESFYTSTSNTAFATTTLAGQSLVAPGVTTPLTTAIGSPGGTYSVTELYTITFGAGGGTVNATIIEKAAAVPEPISMSILGAGLVGMGIIRLRRKS